jgi:hypothetical protein
MKVGELRGVAKMRGVPRVAKLKQTELVGALIEHARADRDRISDKDGWYHLGNVDALVPPGLDAELRERAGVALGTAGHWVCRDTAIFAPCGIITTDWDSVHSAAVGDTTTVTLRFAELEKPADFDVMRSRMDVKLDCDRDKLWAARGTSVDPRAWVCEFGSASAKACRRKNYDMLVKSAESLGFDGMPDWR